MCIRKIFELFGCGGRRIDGHRYIDMGLPSGTLWADRNVGADGVEDDGTFFQWGDFRPFVSVGDYKYRMDPETGMYEKYSPLDRLTVLEPCDDAASVVMGGNWRTPNVEECVELLMNSESAVTVDSSGTPIGIVLTSKVNGNELYFPYGGYHDFTGYVPGGGLVWTSELSSMSYMCPNIMFLEDVPGGPVVGVAMPSERQNGLNVRGVIKLD